jgi:hypothetical protein
MEYIYTATIFIEPRQPKPDATASGSGGGLFADFDLDTMLEPYPKLKAALEQAGPAKIFIQAYLPGEIVEVTINGVSGGERHGGRARWTFSEETPGTFQLRAVSRGPTAGEAALALANLGESTYYKQFNQLIEVDWQPRRDAILEAYDAIQAFRKSQGLPEDGPPTRKETIIGEAAYFAAFCAPLEGKKRCLMPGVHRALPLIKRLAAEVGDNEVAISDLATLLRQLIENDLKTLPDRLKSGSQ